MKKLLALALGLSALASPVMAAACYQDEAGDRLTFTSTDGTEATLVTGDKSESCEAARSERAGWDVFCGSSKTGEFLFRIASKPGFVTKDLLVWRDAAWYPGCKPSTHAESAAVLRGPKFFSPKP